MDTFGWNDGKYLVSSLIYDKQFISCFCYEIIMLKCLSIIKGSFTLAAAVCRFRSGLRQRRDRNFSISAEQRNRLPQTHEENAVMWMSLKSAFLLLVGCSVPSNFADRRWTKSLSALYLLRFLWFLHTQNFKPIKQNLCTNIITVPAKKFEFWFLIFLLSYN